MFIFHFIFFDEIYLTVVLTELFTSNLRPLFNHSFCKWQFNSSN
nr:MAG TPA: hypothetical protein [Caudoviricetes sp.]